MRKNPKIGLVPVKSAGQVLVEALLVDIDAADLELDSRGEALLESVREVRDRMEVLQRVIAEDGERSVSASGMVRLHPGIAEHRAQARTLSLLLAKIDIESPGKDSAKVHAARTRWRAHNADKLRGA